MASEDIAAKAAEQIGRENDNDAGDRIDDIHASIAATAAEVLHPDEPKKDAVKEPVEDEPKKDDAAAALDEKKEEVEEPAAKDGDKKEVEAPSNWSAKDKAIFKRLPSDAREFLVERHRAMEGDYTKKSQTLADRSRQLEGFVAETAPVAQLFQPYRQQMQTAGFTMESMVKAWMDVEKQLLEGKGVEVLRKVAAAYKIPLDRLVEGVVAKEPGKDGAPPLVDPAIIARLDGLETKEQERERIAVETETARVTQEFNTLVSRIDAFEAAQDDKGNPLHPYWKDVINDISAMIHGYRATGQAVPSLDDLYTTAIWANPGVRAKLQAASDEAAEAKRQAAARVKTAAAKKTGLSVTGSNRGGGQPATRVPSGTPASNSIDDDIRASIALRREAQAV